VKLAQLASLAYFPLRFEISFRLSIRYARWRGDIKPLKIFNISKTVTLDNIAKRGSQVEH